MASPSWLSETKTVDLLDCPICMNFMYPPIFQCAKGHILCSNCKVGVNNGKCPSCREPLGNIRCLFAEKVAETLQFPCIYKDNGCSDLLKFDAKKKHEEMYCRHRPYMCPFPCNPPCPRSGDIQTLVTHMERDHQCEVKQGSNIDTLFTLPRNHEADIPCKITIYRSHGKHFCLNIIVLRPPINFIYIYATFMGGEEEAKDFRYVVEVGNHERSIIWKAIPRSIRELSKSYDGMTFNRNIAQSFKERHTADTLTLRVKGSLNVRRPLQLIIDPSEDEG